ISFTSSTYTQQVGDKVTFGVELEDTTDAYIFVGSEDVNYLEVLKVVDDDEDGVVNVTMNTRTAGLETGDSDNSFEIEGDDEFDEDFGTDGVQRVSTSDDINNDEISASLSSPLEEGNYDLRAASSADYDSLPDDNGDDRVEDEEDVATLDLTERSTDAVQSWTAASGTADNFDDTEELLSEVTQTDTIALGDRVVLQV
ncbi:DUF7827 domain-containing protein, partial [Haloferax profundi]